MRSVAGGQICPGRPQGGVGLVQAVAGGVTALVGVGWSGVELESSVFEALGHR